MIYQRLIVLSLLCYTPLFMLAAEGDRVTFSNPLVFSSLQGLITALVQALIVLLIPIVVFFIIYAGFKYVTAQGNPSAIEDANKALLYALIGAVIILGSFAITRIVTNTVEQFRPTTSIMKPSLVIERNNASLWI